MLELFLLGPPRLTLDQTPIELERRKALALLIYLAVTGQPHSRDMLATLFYPDHTQSRARAYLRRDLAVLNTSLNGDWLQADRETVALIKDDQFWLDVAQFRGLVAAVRAHNHPPGRLCPDCQAALARAARLYRDHFLAGFTLRDSYEFDDWQFFQVESLRQDLALVLERLVQAYAAQGDYEAAVPQARRLVALDQLHEPAQRALMQLYHQAGQTAAALRQYEEFVRLLEEELGLPPDEETQTLYEAIRANRLLGSYVQTHLEKLPDNTATPALSQPEPQVSGKPATVASEASPPVRAKVTASNSIIVLPFVNLSSDPECDYFCDGLAEDLINALSKISTLKVVARATAFSFKGEKMGVRQIGEKVGVKTVLEGSVRRGDDQMRITVQLSSVEDGYHLWSARYDRKMDDLFAVQDEISLTIAEKLKLELLGEERQAVVKRYTENIDAYHLYLKGRYFAYTRKGIEFFKAAIDKDPTFALAYSGLADSYSGISLLAYLPPDKSFAIANAAAKKALELDSGLAEAHCSLGLYTFWLESDPDGAAREFQRAIALNPNYAEAHCWYANLLVWRGQTDQAIVEVERARVLDPLSPVIQGMVGFVYYCARRFDKAIRLGKAALEIDPNNLAALYLLAFPYKEKGMYEEAISLLQRAVTVSRRRPFFLGLLGHVFAVSGQKQEAEEILAELQSRENEEYVSPLFYAWLYLGLADTEQALTWFENALEAGYGPYHMFLGDSIYDSIRAEPRFVKILQKIGLERWSAR